MALLTRLSLLTACVALLGGCVGKAINQAQVYAPVTGVVQMEVKVPAGESFVKVQFQVNGEEFSFDEDPSDGFTADIDTKDLPADTLVKLAAVGVRTDGSTMVLRENFILIGKQTSTEEDPAAATDADGEKAATDDQAATEETGATK